MRRPTHELERFQAGSIVGYVTDDGADLFVGSVMSYTRGSYRGAVWASRERADVGANPLSICQHSHRNVIRAIECSERALEEGLA